MKTIRKQCVIQLLLSLLVPLTSLSALEVGGRLPKVTTKGGKTYYDVVVRKIQPGGISIVHRDGATTIPAASLPDALASACKPVASPPAASAGSGNSNPARPENAPAVKVQSRPARSIVDDGFRTWTRKDGKAVELQLLSVEEKDGKRTGEFKMRDGTSAKVEASALIKSDSAILAAWRPLPPQDPDPKWEKFMNRAFELLSGSGDITAVWKSEMCGEDVTWTGRIYGFSDPLENEEYRIVYISVCPSEKEMPGLGTFIFASVVATSTAEEWKALAGLKVGDTVTFSTRPTAKVMTFHGMGVNAGKTIFSLSTKGFKLIREAEAPKP